MGRRRSVEGSALTGTASSPASVPVSSLALNPRNPRDDYVDIGELTDSIMAVGVLQPLGIVRYETFLTHYPDHEGEIGVADWVVLHGNRRLAAARKAGLEEVPVHVVDRLGRDDQLDEAVLVENIHREALPPLREAEALQLLVQRHGSQRQVAQRIGKTNGFVSQRLSLLKLTDTLAEQLNAGSMGIREALSVASHAPDEQERAWEQLQQGSSTQAQSTESTATVDDHSARQSRPARSKTKHFRVRGGSIQDAAEDLRKHFDSEQLAELAQLLRAT